MEDRDPFKKPAGHVECHSPGCGYTAPRSWNNWEVPRSLRLCVRPR